MILKKTKQTHNPFETGHRRGNHFGLKCRELFFFTKCTVITDSIIYLWAVPENALQARREETNKHTHTGERTNTHPLTPVMSGLLERT